MNIEKFILKKKVVVMTKAEIVIKCQSALDLLYTFDGTEVGCCEVWIDRVEQLSKLKEILLEIKENE